MPALRGVHCLNEPWCRVPLCFYSESLLDAYSAKSAHLFRRNGAPFRLKLSIEKYLASICKEEVTDTLRTRLVQFYACFAHNLYLYMFSALLNMYFAGTTGNVRTHNNGVPPLLTA